MFVEYGCLQSEFYRQFDYNLRWHDLFVNILTNQSTLMFTFSIALSFAFFPDFILSSAQALVPII